MEGWGQETQPPYKADTGLQSVGGWTALWSYRYKLSKMYPTHSVFDSCGSSSLFSVSAWCIKRASLLCLHQLWVCEEERGILISERNILKQEISTQWRWRKCREEKKWVQMCFRDPRLWLWVPLPWWRILKSRPIFSRSVPTLHSLACDGAGRSWYLFSSCEFRLGRGNHS